MKNLKTYYVISLVIFSLAMLGAVLNSIVNYDAIVLKIIKLGYPTYVLQILGAAQVIGISILIFNKTNWIREWAYAGFFMNLFFGIVAHLLAKDGNGATAVVCLIILLINYVVYKKMKGIKKQVRKQKQYEPILKKVV
ncbi:DoxX family protein [Cellulophaga sp. E16_2]|uniref:DoxX family protein n=1 Tax=unclassified Cellulophaga TaxID=2634405 RepID=UPI0013FE49F3|nr:MULTISPECIES: DoxX family protein [unclassified Cellulophaga]MBO0593163.1 DoxX family protein [Cellulophaga sp. E16_2]